MLLRLKAWLLKLWMRYERPIRIAMLISGFAFDYVIAKRPDSPFVNILLLSYLVISALCIITLSRRFARVVEVKTEPILLLLILQFCYGGLASNLFILYGKSGTPAGDILFLGLLATLLVGNELLKSRYQELRFNVGIYYLLLLTYCVIAVPTFILHSVGSTAFLISGGVSLAAMAIFLGILSGTARVFRGEVGNRRRIETRITVGGIFLFFVMLYFTNIIPPVPLALKDMGMYHSLQAIPGGTSDTSLYTARYEPPPWWEFWRSTSAVFNAPLGAQAYCFSSVFAPAGLSTPIQYRWEHYDAAAGQWQTEGVFSSPISGGREKGYRGFSAKSITAEGDWRCGVETSQGHTIGRVSFTAVAAAVPPLQVESL